MIRVLKETSPNKGVSLYVRWTNMRDRLIWNIYSSYDIMIRNLKETSPNKGVGLYARSAYMGVLIVYTPSPYY